MKTQPVRNLRILGDFTRYTGLLLIPLFFLGAVYGFIHDCYIICFLVNPLVYSIGISLIIIVIIYDVNDILALFGKAREPQLGCHIKHARAIQEIGLLMSTRDFGRALQKVEKLVAREPEFTSALNMKGEILLEGYQRYDEARECFDRVLKLADPDDEQYKLAEALKAATYFA
ncbi:MAG: tetratricopeptide repeat protein [Desulfobulbaceae bacterium]|nr:tetratricopeptide repeat protein [Desulfobulbaceae bacterium]